MTPRQAETLDFIKVYIDHHGYSPCYREIADDLGLASKSGVARIVSALEREGLVTNSHHHDRGITLVENCPYCGSRL